MFTKEGFSCSLMLATRTVKKCIMVQKHSSADSKAGHHEGSQAQRKIRDLRPMKDNNKLKIQIKGKQTNKKLQKNKIG